MKMLKGWLLAVGLALAGGGAWAQPIQTCTITTQNLVPTGVATAGSACELNTGGMSVVSVQVTGTYTGALSGQVTTDSASWLTLAATTAFTRATTGATSATVGSGVADAFTVVVAGSSSFRLTALAAVTGTATVTMRPAANGGSTGGSGGGGAITAAAGAGVDGWDLTQGAKADAACGTDTGTCSIVSLIKKLNTDVTSTNTQLPTALGQTTKAASLSVALASDQMTATANADANRLPVSVDIASPVTGTAAAAATLSNMPFAVGKGTKSVIVNLTANTATANFEWSTDGVVAYASGQCWLKTNSGNAGSVTTSTSASTYICPVEGTHFQVRQSGAGGVTATVTPSVRDVQQAVAVNVGGGSITASGAAAVGATASGNPLPLAVVGRTAAPTVVTTGQVQQLWGNLSGVPVFLPFTIPELTVQATSGTTALTTNTSTQAFAAPSAGLRNYVTSCEFYNTHATVSTTFSLLDGNAGTAFFTSYLPAITAALPLVPAVVKFPVPLRQPTTATRMDVSAGTTGANVYWNCQGFTAP